MTPPVRLAAITSATLFIALCMLAVVTSQPAQAQTLTVLHNFTGFPEGKTPAAGLSMDQQGRLYGTTSEGGDGACDFGAGCGVVYRLKRAGSGWVSEVLQTFTGPNGLIPLDRVVFGPDGALYGTAQDGGTFSRGVVFRLTPPPNLCHAITCPWRETLLHEFGQDDVEGDFPAAEVLFDQAGNIYGTTQSGGGQGRGVVYKLTRSGSNWIYSVLYDFPASDDGSTPYAGLIFDQAGNLYGTTEYGGPMNWGTVYKLTPSGGAWQETILHDFNGNDGAVPLAGVLFDQAGNLFGATASGGDSNFVGSVFELVPAGGGWNLTTLHRFPVHNGQVTGPWADLTIDSAGNIYGTTRNSGSGCGQVFKMTSQGGSWTFTTIHEFQGSDGCEPQSKVLIDASGNLYGTTRRGGTHLSGVVWEITP